LVAEAEVVYAPSCVDYQPEHVAVARVVADLVRPEQTVRAYEVTTPLTPLLAGCVADIGPVAALEARALAAFRTQRLTVAAAKRIARYRARLYGLEAAEAFWELRGEVYARAMQAGDWREGRSPFRGVRMRPFADPLSAIAGFRARQALRQATAG
jgi:hypothetical protein